MAKVVVLNTRQVMAGFSISDMTVWQWRKGTPTRAKLPVHMDGRNVSFHESEMRVYAKSEGLKWDSAAAHAVEANKLGPKSPAVWSVTAKPVAAKGKQVAAKAKPVAKKRAKVVRKVVASDVVKSVQP